MIPKQSGVALITVLLVVVIATVLATAMVREQRLSIYSARNFFDQSQAKHYATGGEELARQILYEDYQQGGNRDHLSEGWANPQLFYEFEDGDVYIKIIDLQSRININALLADGDLGAQTQARMETLFNQLGVDPAYVSRIRDWIDQDQSVGQLGAEDYEYLGLRRPYRSGNQPMIELSELRSVFEVDREIYATLAPHLTALPAMNTALNVNTASAGVLQSVSSQMTFENADALAQVRNEQDGFQSVTEFLQAPELTGMGVSEAGLGVQSVFFEIQIRARYQERLAYLTSVIQRDPASGSMQVIYRNSSKKILPVVASGEESESDA